MRATTHYQTREQHQALDRLALDHGNLTWEMILMAGVPAVMDVLAEDGTHFYVDEYGKATVVDDGPGVWQHDHEAGAVAR